MIYARYIILARYAEYAPDGTLNLLGGDHDQLTVSQFPWMFPVITAAVRLEMPWEEVRQKIVVEYRIVSSDKKLIAQAMTDLGPYEFDESQSDNIFVCGVVAQIARVVIPSAGPYQFQVVVGSKVLRATFFTVDSKPKAAKVFTPRRSLPG